MIDWHDSRDGTRQTRKESHEWLAEEGNDGGWVERGTEMVDLRGD